MVSVFCQLALSCRCEPGTQLTMRTFHVGGVAQAVKAPEIRVKHSGIIRYEGLRSVQLNYQDPATGKPASTNVVLNKTGVVKILDDDNKELENFKIVQGAMISANDGDRVQKGQLIARWDPHSVPILSDKAGVVKYKDMTDGITYRSDFDAATGRSTIVISEHKEDLDPRIEIWDAKINKGEPIGILSCTQKTFFFLPMFRYTKSALWSASIIRIISSRFSSVAPA